MSNLLKQCFVVESADGKRIINANERMRECLAHNGMNVQVPEDESADGQTAEQGQNEISEEQKNQLEVLRKQIIADAQTMANQITSTAESKARGILDAAKESAQALFDDQRKLGYEEGQRQSAEELRKMEAQLEQQTAQKEEALQQNYENRLDHMESDIVDSVIQVFEKVFQIQFSDKRIMLLALVKNTLMDVDAGNKVRIHVNEADHQMLMEHLEEIQKQVGGDVSIEFVQEAKFADGQCQLETSYGVFDCGVDAQMENLIKDIRSLV